MRKTADTGTFLVLGLGAAAIALRLAMYSGRPTPVQADPTDDDTAARDGFVGIVFDSMAEGLIVADAAGRIVLMNRQAEQMVGGDLRAVPLIEWAPRLGMRLHDGETICPAADFPLVRALRGESLDETELFIPDRSASGGTGADAADPGGVWINGGARPVRDDDGGPHGAVMVFRDVTMRRRAEESLRLERRRRREAHQREAAIAQIEISLPEACRLQALLDRVGDVVNGLLRTSRAFVSIFDTEVLALLVGADEGAASPNEVKHGPPEAAARWIRDHAQPLSVTDARDDPFAPADVTTHGVGSYAGVPVIDDGEVIGVLFAHDEHVRHFPQDDLDLMAAIAARTAACITKVRLYERLRALNVSLERRSAELLEKERRFRTLADKAPVLIWMSGPDGALTYVNRFWLEFTGRAFEQETGRGWTEGLHPEDLRRGVAVHEKAVARRSPFRTELRLRRADGVYRWLLTTGTPRFDADGRLLGFIGSSVDISDQREIQADYARHRAELESLVRERTAELETTHRQLRQADRLASIGTLTAGLGHDMNNVLFPLRCRLDALRWNTVSPEFRDLLQSVAHSVTYLQQLTDGLRLFALDPEDAAASASLTDLRRWWEQVSSLLAKAVPAGVTLESEFDDALPLVRVAPHRLTQAALNLVVNAGEAMPDGGRVQIHVSAHDRAKVCITVRDEGQGMTPQVRLQAFDPFFTTKKRGLATGLGLSLVHGVVTSSRGSIDVDTAPGAGTTVTLTFPAADPSAGPAVSTAVEAPTRVVVDVAEAHLAAWVGSLLTTAGFEVTPGPAEEATSASLWITDADADRVASARRFLAARPGRQVVAIGGNTAGWDNTGVIVVEPTTGLAAIRAAIDLARESSR